MSRRAHRADVRRSPPLEGEGAASRRRRASPRRRCPARTAARSSPRIAAHVETLRSVTGGLLVRVQPGESRSTCTEELRPPLQACFFSASGRGR
jgi:hypothetical protein